MTNEDSLIDRILAGEQQLYAELVNRYKSYAFTIALKILENKPEAEEAAQDAFIKAFHHLANFNRESKFSTWLYRIAFNTAVSYKRKRKGTFQSIENVIVEYGDEGGEGMLERNDKKKFIWTENKQLPNMNPLNILEKKFGYAAFRLQQEAIIQSVLEKKDRWQHK